MHSANPNNLAYPWRSRGRRPLAAIFAIAACFALSSCKDESTTGKGGPSPAPGKAPGAAVDLSAFDKPLKPDGPVKIEIITNGVSPFWDSMGKGMDDAKAELKCEARWQGPEKTDNNTQKQVFETALASSANGIAVSPIQADAFASVIDSAVDKGIPVVTFDSDAAKSKRLAYIGTNNFEAGKKAGEEAVKLFPQGAKFVAFVGNMTAQNAQDRYNGFLEAVKGHNIEPLQDVYEDDKDAVGRAHNNVGDAITKYGDKINFFLGLYSYNGPAIVDKVQQAGIRNKVKIICFDGEPKTLKNLEQGLVDVTIVQKPYEFGRIATKLLYLINRKGYKAAMEELKPELEKAGMTVKDNVIDTGVDVITPTNSAPFLKNLKDKGLTST